MWKTASGLVWLELESEEVMDPGDWRLSFTKHACASDVLTYASTGL